MFNEHCIYTYCTLNLLLEDFSDENTLEAEDEGSTSKTLQEQLCNSASPLINYR